MATETVMVKEAGEAGARRMGAGEFAWRFLTFRLGVGDFAGMDWRHLVLGIVGTVLAGVGRYWDNAEAPLVAKLGTGSVVYLVVFSGVMWVVIRGLRPRRWELWEVVALFSLASFPAWIYAVPVEIFLPPGRAVDANLSFVAVVSVWRVGILLMILRRYAGLSWVRVVVGAFLPLSAAVAVIALMQAMNRVVIVMGGVHPPKPPMEFTEMVVAIVGQAACFALPVLVVAYGVLCVRKPREVGAGGVEGESGGGTKSGL